MCREKQDHQALDDRLGPTARDFLAFMQRREAVRHRRARGAAPPWTDDAVLRVYHFTNVKREHDATTLWMRQHWTGPHADEACGGEVVFNCALFRHFGTVAFARQCGWVRHFCPDKCLLAAVSARSASGHAFSRAYCLPAYNAEIKSEESARREYEKKIARVLTPLWKRRHEFDAICALGRWRDVAFLLGQMPGFGGSGFMVKETLLDVMQTRHLQQCTDRNLWTGIGPGARRGLNRLAGRNKDAGSLATSGRKRKCAEKSGQESLQERAYLVNDDQFLAECVALYRECWRLSPEWCQSLDLELSDTQFQLCEFDKYLRIQNREGGRARRYVPGSAGAAPSPPNSGSAGAPEPTCS